MSSTRRWASKRTRSRGPRRPPPRARTPHSRGGLSTIAALSHDPEKPASNAVMLEAQAGMPHGESLL